MRGLRTIRVPPAADHIQINQATGEFDARGGVETTHLPDQKPDGTARKGSDSGMLDPGEAMQGKADHVVSANHGNAAALHRGTPRSGRAGARLWATASISTARRNR